jgi:hypothetical protein
MKLSGVCRFIARASLNYPSSRNIGYFIFLVEAYIEISLVAYNPFSNSSTASTFKNSFPSLIKHSNLFYLLSNLQQYLALTILLLLALILCFLLWTIIYYKGNKGADFSGDRFYENIRLGDRWIIGIMHSAQIGVVLVGGILGVVASCRGQDVLHSCFANEMVCYKFIHVISIIVAILTLGAAIVLYYIHLWIVKKWPNPLSSYCKTGPSDIIHLIVIALIIIVRFLVLFGRSLSNDFKYLTILYGSIILLTVDLIIEIAKPTYLGPLNKAQLYKRCGVLSVVFFSLLSNSTYLKEFELYFISISIYALLIKFSNSWRCKVRSELFGQNFYNDRDWLQILRLALHTSDNFINKAKNVKYDPISNQEQAILDLVVLTEKIQERAYRITFENSKVDYHNKEVHAQGFSVRRRDRTSIDIEGSFREANFATAAELVGQQSARRKFSNGDTIASRSSIIRDNRSIKLSMSRFGDSPNSPDLGGNLGLNNHGMFDYFNQLSRQDQLERFIKVYLSPLLSRNINLGEGERIILDKFTAMRLYPLGDVIVSIESILQETIAKGIMSIRIKSSNYFVEYLGLYVMLSVFFSHKITLAAYILHELKVKVEGKNASSRKMMSSSHFIDPHGNVTSQNKNNFGNDDGQRESQGNKGAYREFNLKMAIQILNEILTIKNKQYLDIPFDSEPEQGVSNSNVKQGLKVGRYFIFLCVLNWFEDIKKKFLMVMNIKVKFYNSILSSGVDFTTVLGTSEVFTRTITFIENRFKQIFEKASTRYSPVTIVYANFLDLVRQNTGKAKALLKGAVKKYQGDCNTIIDCIANRSKETCFVGMSMEKQTFHLITSHCSNVTRMLGHLPSELLGSKMETILPQPISLVHSCLVHPTTIVGNIIFGSRYRPVPVVRSNSYIRLFNLSVAMNYRLKAGVETVGFLVAHPIAEEVSVIVNDDGEILELDEQASCYFERSANMDVYSTELASHLKELAELHKYHLSNPRPTPEQLVDQPRLLCLYRDFFQLRVGKSFEVKGKSGLIHVMRATINITLVPAVKAYLRLVSFKVDFSSTVEDISIQRLNELATSEKISKLPHISQEEIRLFNFIDFSENELLLKLRTKTSQAFGRKIQQRSQREIDIYNMRVVTDKLFSFPKKTIATKRVEAFGKSSWVIESTVNAIKLDRMVVDEPNDSNDEKHHTATKKMSEIDADYYVNIFYKKFLKPNISSSSFYKNPQLLVLFVAILFAITLQYSSGFAKYIVDFNARKEIVRTFDLQKWIKLEFSGVFDVSSTLNTLYLVKQYNLTSDYFTFPNFSNSTSIVDELKGFANQYKGCLAYSTLTFELLMDKLSYPSKWNPPTQSYLKESLAVQHSLDAVLSAEDYSPNATLLTPLQNDYLQAIQTHWTAYSAYQEHLSSRILSAAIWTNLLSIFLNLLQIFIFLLFALTTQRKITLTYSKLFRLSRVGCETHRQEIMVQIDYLEGLLDDQYTSYVNDRVLWPRDRRRENSAVVASGPLGFGSAELGEDGSGGARVRKGTSTEASSRLQFKRSSSYRYGLIKVFFLFVMTVIPLSILHGGDILANYTKYKVKYNLLSVRRANFNLWLSQTILKICLLQLAVSSDNNSILKINPSALFEAHSKQLKNAIVPSFAMAQELELGEFYEAYHSYLNSYTVCEAFKAESYEMPGCGQGGTAHLKDSMVSSITTVVSTLDEAYFITKSIEGGASNATILLFNQKFSSYLNYARTGKLQEAFYLPLENILDEYLLPMLSSEKKDGGEILDATNPIGFVLQYNSSAQTYISVGGLASALGIILLLKYVLPRICFILKAFHYTSLLVPWRFLLRNPLLSHHFNE